MTKRALIAMALIGLCSAGFVACGGDDDDNSSKNECATSDDCKDSAKPVCENKVCVAAKGDADADASADADDDKDACSNEGSIVCETVDGVTRQIVCSGKKLVSTDCKSNEICKETVGCYNQSGEGCLSNGDCKDASKPYCDTVKHECVATDPGNTEDVCIPTCTDGAVCRIDICVTDDMKTVDAECVTYSNEGYFCDGDDFWYCDKNQKRQVEKCKETGFGSCSRYRDSADESGFNTAQCTGSEDMIAHCNGDTAMLCDPTGLGKYKCVEDIRGNKMAVYAGEGKDCPNGCEYGDDGAPKCK